MNDKNFSVDLNYDAPNDWNDFLLKSKIGTIHNTVEYAHYAKHILRWTPIYLRLINSRGEISLQNLLFEYNPAIIKIPAPLQIFYRKLRKRLRWSYGPIGLSEDSIKAFFEYLIKTKKKFYGTTHPLSKIPDNIPVSKQKWGTFIIDLNNSKETIFENFEKHSAKKNIKRSVEKNITVEEINEKSLVEYHYLLNNYRKATQKNQVNYASLLEMWNSLKKVGFKGFLAKKNDIPVGGLIFSYFNGYIHEWGVARSNDDYINKLYSQDLLKWRIIEWGINNNMKWFDLSGFNPNPISKKEEGILRYKRKWGGKQYDYWIVKSD